MAVLDLRHERFFPPGHRTFVLGFPWLERRDTFSFVPQRRLIPVLCSSRRR